LACLPVWLTSEEVRQGKLHESVILAFKSEEEVKKALRNQLVIAGVSVRTAVYLVSKLTDQCKRCQKFDHHQTKCQNQETCQFCAGNYNTRQHECFLCLTQIKGTICAHTVYKCVNCQKKHQSNSVECSVFKALQPILSTADSLAMKV